MFYFKILKCFTGTLLLTNWFLRNDEDETEICLQMFIKQTLANNSTPPRYSKNIRYSAIIWGRIVGQILVQYSTRPRVEYLYRCKNEKFEKIIYITPNYKD